MIHEERAHLFLKSSSGFCSIQRLAISEREIPFHYTTKSAQLEGINFNFFNKKTFDLKIMNKVKWKNNRPYRKSIANDMEKESNPYTFYIRVVVL